MQSVVSILGQGKILCFFFSPFLPFVLLHSRISVSRDKYLLYTADYSYFAARALPLPFIFYSIAQRAREEYA